MSQVIIWLFVGGLATGLLSGMLGVGGGILLIPLMDWYFESSGFDPDTRVKLILANSFVCIIFAGLASSFKQYKKGNFYPKEIGLTALPALIASTLTSWLIASFNWYNEQLFKWIFISFLVFIILRSSMPKKTVETEVESKDLEEEHKKGLLKPFVGTGLATGLASALSGLGGGIIMIPLFTSWLKMPLKKAASISIGVIPVLVIPVVIVYGLASVNLPNDIPHWGYVVPLVSIPVALGVVISAGLGVRLAHFLSPKVLNLTFKILVLLVIFKTAYQLL